VHVVLSGTREVERGCEECCPGLLAVVSRRCCHGGCALGQSSADGALSGFVVDATGGALVGAVVQVQNLANGLTAVAKTEGRVRLVPRILSRSRRPM
jgi:hypothetical protein